MKYLDLIGDAALVVEIVVNKVPVIFKMETDFLTH